MPARDRTELRATNDRLWGRAITRIRQSLRFQWWIKFALIIVGGAAGSIGAALEGGFTPAQGSGILTLKGLLVIGGFLAVALGAFLLLVVEEPMKDLLEAHDLVRKAEGYLDELDELDRQVAEYEALDLRRRARIEAAKQMREAVEQALANAAESVGDAAQFLLETAIASIETAAGFDPGELWSISVFEIQGRGAAKALRRVAVARADRGSERGPPRSWRKGEGFVGVAWLNNRDVIIPDSQADGIAHEYPVPPRKAREGDSERYRSMAAIPIHVGRSQDIWGVVAFSSDREGRFRRDPDNNRAQSVDTVRMFAGMMALLAAVLPRP
jgi:hypothetical protein